MECKPVAQQVYASSNALSEPEAADGAIGGSDQSLFDRYLTQETLCQALAATERIIRERDLEQQQHIAMWLKVDTEHLVPQPTMSKRSVAVFVRESRAALPHRNEVWEPYWGMLGHLGSDLFGALPNECCGESDQS